MTRPEYLYIGTEDVGPTTHVKIGKSHDPWWQRSKALNTGNWRKLRILLAIAGGQELETEVKRKFQVDRIGDGGTEWFKWTTELRDFIFDAIDRLLLTGPILPSKQFGNGPNSLQIAELGDAPLRQVRSVAVQGAIQPHDIATATRPKSVYERIRKVEPCKSTQ